MGTLIGRLFGFLVPERELTVDPKDHPYYPGEGLETVNPDVGPRCGECRLGLGRHDERDPYCDHYDPTLLNKEAP